MNRFRAVLLLSIAAAFAVAFGIGAALGRAGVAALHATGFAVAALVVLLIPLFAAEWWTKRQRVRLRELTRQARRIADGEVGAPITVGDDDYVVNDLARAIEQIRLLLVRHRGAAQEHRATIEQIVDSIGEGFIAVSRDRRVVLANRRVAEMFSSSGELAGRSILEAVRKQSVLAALESALRGEAATERLAYGRADGDRQIEMRAVPVAASPDIAAVALFIDVTEIERLQRVRKDFLDDFSHEVRTPLAGLRSAAESLDHPGLTGEDEQQLRSVMQRQIARIERLVRDVAELNQIESGKLVLERTSASLLDLLDDVQDEFRRRTNNRFTIHGEDVVAVIDPPRAQQIFANLLDNAARHSPPGGEVSIELRREGDEAVVRVSDRGPGIPPHELDRIFHRFYRVDRSRSQPGTGLGLAIARHLAALHGGTIRAFNRAEGGAVFEVRLPVGREKDVE